MRLRVVLLLLCISGALAQEITLEEIEIEAVYISPLELPLSKSLDRLAEQLRLMDEQARAQQLRATNESSVTKVLELTRYIPIPLGASESRIDTFFQQNYMRADLNPPAKSTLFDR